MVSVIQYFFGGGVTSPVTGRSAKHGSPDEATRGEITLPVFSSSGLLDEAAAMLDETHEAAAAIQRAARGLLARVRLRDRLARG